jgi:hypothetical protein
MRLNDFFKTERAIQHLAEDVGMTGKLPDTPDMKYMARLKDLFKVDGETPQLTVSKVIHMIMDRPASRTTRIYMNDVLQGATKAGIRIEPALRQHAEEYLDEGVIPTIKPLTEDIDVDGISILNGVTYDQLTGAGAVPYNREIETFGVGVLMKPSVYLSLVLPLRGNEPTSQVSAAVGQERPIASPWLALKFGDNNGALAVEESKILSHQGRHRAKQIMEKYGDVEMLVHLIYIGARPRQVPDAILEEINQGVINESGNFIHGPFWVKV